MSGNRYLLDTNAIIQLLDGNRHIEELLNKAESVAMSVISEFEFLAYAELEDQDIAEYKAFRAYINVFDVPSDDFDFTQLVVQARKNFNLKLPDAIIAATARTNGLAVLTADDHFKPLTGPWLVCFYTLN